MLTLLLLVGLPTSNDLDFSHLLGQPIEAFSARIGKPAEGIDSLVRYKNSYLLSLGIKSIDMSSWPTSKKTIIASPITIRFDGTQIHDWKQALGALGFDTSGVKVMPGKGSWLPLRDSLTEYLKDSREAKPTPEPLLNFRWVYFSLGAKDLGALTGYERGRWQWLIQFMPKASFDGNDPELRIEHLPKVY